MQNPAEQAMRLCQVQLATNTQILNLLFNSMNQIAKTSMKAMQDTVQDELVIGKSASQHDLSALPTLAQQWLPKQSEKVMAYQQSVMQIMASTQHDIMALVQKQWQKAQETAPAFNVGTEPADNEPMAIWASLFSTWDNAIKEVSSSAMQTFQHAVAPADVMSGESQKKSAEPSSNSKSPTMAAARTTSRSTSTKG